MSALSSLSFGLDASARIEFGVGAISRLPGCVEDLGGRTVFLVTDVGMRATGIVDRVAGLIEAAGLSVTVYDAVTPNPSTATLDAAAPAVRAAARSGDCVVVALGGGSVLDAAKGIALLATNLMPAGDLTGATRTVLPGLAVVAVPTTAGTGAETNGFGVIEDERACRKVYIGHRSVRPAASVLDPGLTVGLPPGPTAATGMDALVHGIESLASRRANPVSVAYASEAVRLVSASLAAAVADGSDLEARASLLMGAHLSGLALSISGLGVVHGLAHATTAHTGAVHGLALSSVLTEVMARTAPAAGAAYARAAEAMGAADAVSAAGALADEVGARRPLRDLGVTTDLVVPIAAGALADAVSSNHPRRMDPAEVEDIVLACR
ncbi:MAG: methanol dehydrogenase [Nocardioidaceae bacterium]|nr:methanol dehydrogenase [Nocardioidaceae bacterium]